MGTGPTKPVDRARAGRPTLKTIAAMTGLSRTAVSRALKDAPDIGAETKRRVQEVAARIGYRPNWSGVRLRTGRTMVIALVLSGEESAMMRTAQIVSSIARALSETPYQLIISINRNDDDPMDTVRFIVESHSADGLILHQTLPEDPRVAFLHELGIPFATYGRTDQGIDHPYVDLDVESFCREAVRRLAARGRRRIALLSPPGILSYAGLLRQAFDAVTAELGVEGRPVEGVTAYDSAETMTAHLGDLLARPDRPDAVISATMLGALSAVSAIDSAGLEVGSDVAVVAREPTPLLSIVRKEIIVARDDYFALGRLLAQAILQAIDHPERPPVQRLLKSSWREV